MRPKQDTVTPAFFPHSVTYLLNIYVPVLHWKLEYIELFSNYFISDVMSLPVTSNSSEWNLISASLLNFGWFKSKIMICMTLWVYKSETTVHSIRIWVEEEDSESLDVVGM
jgi:hypothetical protein